jgi:squalene-hopene/tetraprenyl-beta-curcumene cyclase
MEAYLIKCQFDDGDGFAPKDAAFGGWGFDAARQPGQPGHMDLAHTQRALAALHQQSFSIQRDAIRERALEFLKVVQKHPDAHQRQPLIEGFSPMTAPIPYDGGFYFSPVVLAANKGREEFKDAKYFRSYATATCDGILALIAAGVSRDDQRVVRAVAWLRAHDDLTYPQGVPTDHPEPWGEAIRYYHFAVRAEAYDVLDWPGDWRARLGAVIGVHQLADGSFRNAASPLMKEDDPLLCTALAATALAHCAANR